MVQGIVEWTTPLGMNYCFVSAHKQANLLILHSLTTCCNPLDKKIQLTEIDALTYQSTPYETTISFDYQGEHYHFVDYGQPLFTFLKRTLPFPSIF